MPQPINETCPWSGKPVAQDSLTRWNGQVVGFCNPGCRDKFDAATAHFTAAAAASPAPPTLLDLASARPRPAALSEAVLVVIDAQEEYRSGRLPLEGIAAASERLARLLERARAGGTPVIHVAHRGPAGGLFDRSAAGGGFLEAAMPAAGEAVVEKALPNAFAGTDLQARIAASGRGKLLLVGFMTHLCVSSTARAALDLGLPVTVAGDATATRALPDPMGGPPLPAEWLQRTALAALADRFAVVVPAEAVPA